MEASPDVLIIGGGVIGAAIAHRLSGEGVRCVVIDRDRPGREASWAAAGVLVQAHGRDDARFRDLCRASYDLYPPLVAQILESTGIDVGYRRWGVMSLFFDPADREVAFQTARDSFFEPGTELDGPEARDLEPSLGPSVAGAFHSEEAAQVHNPRLVEGFLAAAHRQGAEIRSHAPLGEVVIANGRVRSVSAGGEHWTPGTTIVAAGAWSGEVAGRFGLTLPIEPMRGQIVLSESIPPLFRTILMLGDHYVVSRPHGRILAGSTVERAGFDKRVTAEGVAGVLSAARTMVPALARLPVLRCWAGLRPGSPDGMPFLDRIPGVENAFVAAGHFRNGLLLSPLTAEIIADLVCHRSPRPGAEIFRLEGRAAGRPPLS